MRVELGVGIWDGLMSLDKTNVLGVFAPGWSPTIAPPPFSKRHPFSVSYSRERKFKEKDLTGSIYFTQIFNISVKNNLHQETENYNIDSNCD